MRHSSINYTNKNMAKQNNSKHNKPTSPKENILHSFWLQAVVLIIIGFCLYANSFQNQYALDDGIVIQKNEYVQKGFSGIGKILKTDAYDSFYKSMNSKQQLSGGRYRPLSVVTFAIEQQLFGNKTKPNIETDVATVRHVFNVLFYILSVVLLLYFLRTYLFKQAPVVAFLTCLLFLIHPVHTEVISNIKSRDEILSFLFIVLTFISAFRYRENKKLLSLFFALVCYFFALLSKEYAVTLVVLLPMLFYIVTGESFKQSLIAIIPFLFVAFIYILIRYTIVKTGASGDNPDVLNNPFKFATGPERLATKLEILNHYLRLLFYPHPLSSDYSYNAIPYTNFANPLVWFSILFHLSAIAATVFLFLKRNIIAFALAFYLLHLLLVSNLLMNLGATMGERLIYHSSFGFAIILAIGINWLLQKINASLPRQAVLVVFTLVISLTAAAVVIPRNFQWKNDTALFIADAQTMPNSALISGNAGKAYLDLTDMPENKAFEKEYIRKAIYHLSKSVSIHTEYVNGYLNLGVAYYKLADYDSAKIEWDKAKEIYPNNPFVIRNLGLLAQIYYNNAMLIGDKQPQTAVAYLEKAVEMAPQNDSYWYNLGGAYYTIHDFAKARTAWTQAIQLNPANQQAQQGLAALPTQ